MAYRRMQTAPRWSLALVTLLAWFGGTMMGLALTPDGMALLQFKDALTTISPVLEGWNASDPSPCSWGGINCTAAGRVSQILLLYQVPPLEGHLSASLGELTSLEVLVLDGNLLSGSIPPEIGNLTSLAVLSVSFQNFSGEVPLQLFNCRNLVQLWLNSNDFTGDITTALEELSTLPAIEQIGLSNNAFTGTLPPSIGNATTLIYLSMGESDAVCARGQRGGGFGGEIPKELGKLVNLSTLWLGCDNLSGQIPPGIGNLTLLTSFDLGQNNLSGEIPRSLGSMASLSQLWLHNNELSGPIPSYFGNMTNLTILDFSYNNLTGPIPSSLGNLTGLTTLYLGSNSLSGSIPSSLGNLVNLTVLGLFSNSFSGPIPASIASLINLSDLFFDGNSLSGPIPVNLSEVLTSIELLYMDSNNLSGPIPESFGRFMPNLTLVDIANNSFNGTLPDGLCHGGKLTELAAYNNNLEGPIPPSLGSCSSLKRTLLSYNQFTSIPTGFGRNSALAYLDVSNNQLAGPLPAGLGVNSSLAFLDLSANLLTGDMSRLEFAQLGNLASLHLASNNLTGEIPAAMGLCNLLFVVDLSYNSLTGAVPLALANLSALLELNLQGNNLTALNTGVYTGWGSTLQTLNLAENPWNAPIEPEIGSLRLLQSLNLSYGGLTGPIPPVLAELTQLEVLDLSHNNLTGQVPSALGGMVSLISVDVSFNGLTGSLPPQWVKFLVADPASFRGNPGLCMQYDTDNVCMEGLGAGGGWRLKLSERVRVAVGVGVGVVGVASWALGVLAALRFRRRKKPQVEPNIMPEEKITTQNLTKEPLPLTFEQILNATENLTGTQIIGKGGHGVVFKVKCPSDYHRPFIAVKKIQFEDVKPTMLHKSFWSEVDTVGQARHRNLVRLLGFLKRDRVGLLVYDYVSNGDLFSALHDRNGSLPWKARFGIARDVARGLAYLHHDYDAPIVHRDIKSSNVLLDDHLEGYISDFGLAKVLDTLSGPKSDQLSATMSVVGTCGYIAPEVGYSKVVTSKVDVYAYGILVLELLTGKLPVDDSGGDPSSDEASHLVAWVKAQVQLNPGSGGVIAVLDPCLIPDAMDDDAMRQMLRLQEVGLMCTHKQPAARPSMRGVEAMLDIGLMTPSDGHSSITPAAKEHRGLDGFHEDCHEAGLGSPLSWSGTTDTGPSDSM